MDWTPVFEFLKTLAPWVEYLLVGLGSLMVIASGIDSVVDDSKDGGFYKKIKNIPILGSFLGALEAFSIFRTKK